MSFMDTYLSDDLADEKKKKVQSKASSSSFMGSYLDPNLGETAKQPEIAPQKEINLPVFDTPSPIAQKPFGESTPSAVDSFTSAIGKGNFTVTGTEDKALVQKNNIVSGFDSATNKQAFKNTLSPYELDILKTERPEMSQYSNPSIYDAEVKGSDYSLGQTTLDQGTASTAIDALKSNQIPEYLGKKGREYVVEDLVPAGEKIVKGYEAATDTSKSGIDRTKGALKSARGIVDSVFAPLSFGARQIADESNPEDMTKVGNLTNKILTFPFEVSSGILGTAGKIAGMDEQTAEDFGIVMATFIPLLKSAKNRGATTKEISTIVDSANNAFAKSRDLSPEGKAIYKEGAMELHPDISGLPDVYMTRLNEAMQRGDVKGMEAIVAEGKAAKVDVTARGYTNSSEMKKQAAEGNQNAQVRNSIYQENIKDTSIISKNEAGSPILSVDTVPYSDGTFMVRTTVETSPGTEVATQFSGEYKSELEAVEAGIQEAKELAKDSENLSKIEEDAVEFLNEQDKMKDMEIDYEIQQTKEMQTRPYEIIVGEYGEPLAKEFLKLYRGMSVSKNKSVIDSYTKIEENMKSRPFYDAATLYLNQKYEGQPTGESVQNLFETMTDKYDLEKSRPKPKVPERRPVEVKEEPKETKKTPFSKAISEMEAKLEKIQPVKSNLEDAFHLGKVGFIDNKAQIKRGERNLDKTIENARKYTEIAEEIENARASEAAHDKVSKRIQSIENVLEKGELKGEKISPAQRKEIEAVLKKEKIALGRIERSKYFEKAEKPSVPEIPDNSVSVSPLTEGPLKGKFQAYDATTKKFGIGATEAEARANLEKSIKGEEVKVEVPKESNKKPETKPAPKPEIKQPSNKKADTSKMRELAQKMRDKAEAELDKPRQDNTARRARMADSARDAMRQEIEFANTFEKIADAIDSGEAKALNRLSTKADLARLESAYRVAKYRAARALSKDENKITSKEAAQHAEIGITRHYMNDRQVSELKPSDYSKATKAGANLKEFFRRHKSGDKIDISRWEKEVQILPEIISDTYTTRSMVSDLRDYKSMEKLIGDSNLAEVFAELDNAKTGSAKVESAAETLKREERDLVQRTKIEGFFPTPEKTVERMIDEASIKEGMRVLEPSAGIGSIADKIREAGVEPQVGEYSPTLSQHLEKKGYNVISSDFMELPKSEKFDRIIMNPPFERMQDVDHVMKAYEHLAEDGRIVAITSESPFFRSDKKAVEFRDWLDKVGGYSEKLPEGTFKESLRQTGVATRLVIIDKMREKALEEAVKTNVDVSDNGTREPSTARRVSEKTLANKGAQGIGTFENRAEKGTPAFKLAERVKEMIDKMETNFTKYVSPGSDGTFFLKSKNIAIKSTNDVAVVHHELSHLIDDKLGISAEVMKPVGFNKAGLPIYEKATASLRKQFTNIYVQYYPGALKTDKLKIRMMEGYAVLQQKALETPSIIREEYPELWSKYVENAVDMQKALNEGMTKIVEDYQGLSANDKIGSVLTDETKNTQKDTFLNAVEKIEEQMVNNVVRFEKLDRMVQNTGRKSVSNLLYANKAVSTRVYRNIVEKKQGFWHFRNGELVKMHDYNWAGLVSKLGDQRSVDTFSNWLVARDQYFERQRLEKLKTEFAKMEIEGMFEADLETMGEFPTKEEMQVQIQELEAYLKENEKILPKNVVDEMYNSMKDSFAEEAKMFDSMVEADLRFLRDSGTLSAEKFDQYTTKEGYAPMRRMMEDEIIAGEKGGMPSVSIGGVKISKASQLKQRTGGTQSIINPLLGAISNHREAMMKGYKQMTLNRLYDTLAQIPELAQELEIRTTMIDGKVMRTANGKDISKDPNIIVKMEDGKPQAIAVSETISKPLEMIFTPQSMSLVENSFVGASRLFSKGTTGIYPLFAITNAIRDQFTALIHTQNNYIPIYDQLRQLTPALLFKDSKEYTYAREFLGIGGSNMTRLKFSEATGKEVLDFLEKEEKGLKKVSRWLDAGLDIIAIPANWSEIGTRMVEYVKARKSGKDMFTALEEAGQVTAPFHHEGLGMKNQYVRGTMRSIPYLNAILQGASQYIATVRRGKEGRIRYGLAIAAVLAATYYNLQAIEDSDDMTKQAFIQLDPDSLSKFLYIPDKLGELYKMAIPQEVGFYGAVMSMVYADVKFGANYSPREYVDATLSFLPDTFRLDNPTKAILSVIPQLLKPAVETIFNTTTFPNVRPIENMADEQVLPQFRTAKNTSEFAKWLSSAGVIDLSPKKIDHLLEGYFGRAIGYATMKPNVYDPSSPIKQPEYFTSGRMLQKFYEVSETTTQANNSVRKGLMQMSEEDQVILNAKKGLIDDTWDKIKELKSLDENTPEFREKRQEIWDNVQNVLKYGKDDISSKEYKAFYDKQEKSKWQDEKGGVVARYVDMYKQSTDTFKATKLENELKKEIIGDTKKTDPEYSKLVSRASSLIQDFRANRTGDEFISQLKEYNTNAAKVDKFKELRSELGDEAYKARIFEYKKQKLISDDLYNLIRK